MGRGYFTSYHSKSRWILQAVLWLFGRKANRLLRVAVPRATTCTNKLRQETRTGDHQWHVGTPSL